jgi:Wzt C-terminal domain/Sulfotransferase family
MMHRTDFGQYARTVFDHIPKTGGTSIIAALEQGLGEQNIRQDIFSPHHIVVACAGLRRAISSHFWFYPGELLVTGWFYATLLRDPVDRFLSEYYYNRQLSRQLPTGVLNHPAVHHEDLESYVLDGRPETTRAYSNVQAIHFAARICERPYELSQSQLLDAAIASLMDYDLIGIYTDINVFVEKYCDCLGVPRQKLPRLNTTSERKLVHEISHDAQHKLFAANTADLALIEWGRHHSAQRRPPATRATVARMASFGTREIEILAVDLLGTSGVSPSILRSQRVYVRLRCRSTIPEDDLTAGIAVHTAAGREAIAVNSKMLGISLAVPANSEFVLCIEFNACFAVGDYQISLAMIRGLHHLEHCFHWTGGVKWFRIEPGQVNHDAPEPDVTFAIEGTPRKRRRWHGWRGWAPAIR